MTAAVTAACMLGMWLGVLRAVLYGMVVLSLAAAAFFAGAITARKTAKLPPLKIAQEIPDEDLAAARALFDEALAARFAGRHREALARLEEARTFHPAMRGLEYQFALTSLDLGEFGPAEDHARRSIDRGEETGNAQALLGLILLEKSRRDGTVAAQGGEILARLQASREADPLNPMPLYAMGEYYRSAGAPELAVDAYRRAIERVSKTDSYLVTTVKAGLAGLRLSHRSGAPPLKLLEINGVLPPEQLFFGAADALLREDNATAAGFLGQARQRLPDEAFQALLQDSFFQDYLKPGILEDPPKPASQP